MANFWQKTVSVIPYFVTKHLKLSPTLLQVFNNYPLLCYKNVYFYPLLYYKNMFKRFIIKDLKQWSERPSRKPLVLRGARQVGKTTVIEMFSGEFDQYINLNLDNPEERSIFREDASFKDILSSIYYMKSLKKQNKKTLIFIDEIQNSPRAINLLRYFYEETPELNVIAAGSLLETLINRQISFPVGRVEYLPVYPCSFLEFLTALGENLSLDILSQIPVPNYAHDKLLKLYREYTIIGGMPEVLESYLENRDIVSLSKIYESLILTYLDDVEKYAKNDTMAKVIRHIIKSSFFHAASRIKFAGFGNSVYKSREVSEAFEVLQKAMLAKLIYPVTNLKFPIKENFRKSPKLQLLDTGLVNYFSGMQKDLFVSSQLDEVYEGRIAEHIVGQELRAISKSLLESLSFWTREEKHSDAEVDFIRKYDGLVIPIEVKSKTTGRLRSLHQFMDKADHRFAVRIYSGKLKIEKTRTLSGKSYYLLNLPFYLTHKIDDYLNLMIQDPEKLK